MRIALEGVSWAAGAAPIVEDITATIEPGRTVGVVGPNGAGKSTLLRCLAGLQRPTSGTITYDGRDLQLIPARDRARHVAFVEQHAHTHADLTVQDVVELGRIPYRKRFSLPSDSDSVIVSAALAQLGLTGYEEQPWNTLSGGEQQRAYLAKALAQQPRAILLDEPTNHLDIKHQFDVLYHLAHTTETVVVALHDLGMAIEYCDEIIVMHQGRIVVRDTSARALTPERVRQVFEVDAELHEGMDRTRLMLGRLHPTRGYEQRSRASEGPDLR